MNEFIVFFSRLIFGTDPSRDFYSLLEHRTLPALDQSAAQLRARIEANLRRDSLCKRVFRWSLLLSIIAVLVASPFAPSDPAKATAARIAQKQEQFQTLQKEVHKIYTELRNGQR